MNERYRGYGAFHFAKLPLIGPFTGFLDGHRGLSPWYGNFDIMLGPVLTRFSDLHDLHARRVIHSA